MPNVLRAPYPESAGSSTRYGVSGLHWGFAVDEMTPQSDNTAVSSVPDILGNYNLTQVIGARQPKYRTSQINSLPAIQFNSLNNEYLDVNTASLNTLTAAEVFLIVKATNDPAAATSSSGLWYFSSAVNVTHYPFTDGTIYDNFGTNTRKTTVNPTPSLAAWRCYQVSSSSGNWTSWLDGTQIYTTATNTVGWDTTGTFTVGLSGAGVNLLGYVAEMIVYDHVLSSGERSSVKSGLASKYGLTLA